MIRAYKPNDHSVKNQIITAFGINFYLKTILNDNNLVSMTRPNIVWVAGLPNIAKNKRLKI